MVKKTLSTSEVAKLLGISRVAVFKQIKSGRIHAKKSGRNFVVQRKDIPAILGSVLKPSNKSEIERSVRRTVLEYGEALKLLGKE